MALAALIHAGWLAIVWWHAKFPIWALMVAGGWFIAWHGSLQHETIHGHPTSLPRVNALIGSIPLSLWLPYRIYCRTHLAHHRTPAVTDPYEDPESRYLTACGSRLGRVAGRLEATLLGRLILGPPLTVGRLLVTEALRASGRPLPVIRDWLPHLAGVAVVVLWLRFCGFGLGRYVLLCVYPGVALTLLRSFAEHRAHPEPEHRVAVVENAGPLGLLYLHNNLHAAHHHLPSLPWYALPAFHARHRDALLAANGGLLYRGYGQIAARFLLRPHDRLLHPDHG